MREYKEKDKPDLMKRESRSLPEDKMKRRELFLSNRGLNLSSRKPKSRRHLSSNRS